MSILATARICYDLVSWQRLPLLMLQQTDFLYQVKRSPGWGQVSSSMIWKSNQYFTISKSKWTNVSVWLTARICYDLVSWQCLPLLMLQQTDFLFHVKRSPEWGQPLSPVDVIFNFECLYFTLFWWVGNWILYNLCTFFLKLTFRWEGHRDGDRKRIRIHELFPIMVRFRPSSSGAVITYYLV